MLRHKLRMVKVRKQIALDDSCYAHDTIPECCYVDGYCFQWMEFFDAMRYCEAREVQEKNCSHCDEAMAPPRKRWQLHRKITEELAQCTLCNQCTCAAWSDRASLRSLRDASFPPCPKIRQCQHCFERCCSKCRSVSLCVTCGDGSCSVCEPTPLRCQRCEDETFNCAGCILQCKDCNTTMCDPHAFEVFFKCDLCHQTYCDGNYCQSEWHCQYEKCEHSVCDDCIVWCNGDNCDMHVCIECDCNPSCGMTNCVNCFNRLCSDCCRFDKCRDCLQSLEDSVDLASNTREAGGES